MEYKEALGYLEVMRRFFTNDDDEGKVFKQTYDVGIEALEKQIPKKPHYYGDEDDGKILCPNCETDLYDDRECGFNHCPYCGQAIDWSDTNAKM